jgi:hypothetical protein
LFPGKARDILPSQPPFPAGLHGLAVRGLIFFCKYNKCPLTAPHEIRKRLICGT